MQGRREEWGRGKALKFREHTQNWFCAYKLRSLITVTGGCRQSRGKAGEPYGQPDVGRDGGRGLTSVLLFTCLFVLPFLLVLLVPMQWPGFVKWRSFLLRARALHFLVFESSNPCGLDPALGVPVVAGWCIKACVSAKFYGGQGRKMTCLPTPGA